MQGESLTHACNRAMLTRLGLQEIIQLSRKFARVKNGFLLELS